MSKPEPLQTKVERVIKAPPTLLYDLVSDVTRIGEWSPECIEASWLDGATGPAVGVRFKGKNKLGFSRWSTKPTITEAEPGKVFAFKIPGDVGPVWRYEFHDDSAGTRVVESVQQQEPVGGFVRFLQRRNGVTDRRAHVTAGMHTTLDRLAASAEATATAPTLSTQS